MNVRRGALLALLTSLVVLAGPFASVAKAG